MTLDIFPNFLTFLTQAPCFPGPASTPPGRARKSRPAFAGKGLGPLIAGAGPGSTSEAHMAPRRRLPDRPRL